MAYYNPYRKRNYQTIKHRSPYEKTEAQKRLEAAEAAKRKEEEKPNGAVRSLATVGDVLANVYTGAVKGVEGVVDLLIGATGTVGGLVSDDFQDAMESAVKYDFAGQAAGGNYLQELTKYSYTNDGKVGEIVENIANGVGQMLPTVAAAIATGGTSLGAQGAQIAGMAAASASAAGSATESALNDGAGYYQALGYGATMGAVEGATEKLLGGVDVKAIKGIGKGLAKEAGEEIAEQGGKRILKGMLEEAGEEAISELVDPMARTMYQGGEALGDYLTPEYWQGVGEAALVGGLTGAAYSGTVGHWIHKAKGTNADMDASFETVESLQKQQRKLDADGKLDGKQYSDIQSNIKGNMENVSKVLKKASPEKRAKLIEKYRIDSMFDGNGDMRADYAQKLDRQIEAGKRGNMSPYVSPDLAADEERLNAGIEAINSDILRTEQQGVDKETALQYNKNKPSYDSFSTEAMKWARSAARKAGEQRVLYNAKDNTWNLIEAVASDDVFVVVKSLKDTPKNAPTIEKLRKEARDDHNGKQSRSSQSIYENIDVYGDVRRDNRVRGSVFGKRGTNGQSGELHSGTADNDGIGAVEKAGGDNRRQNLKYSKNVSPNLAADEERLNVGLKAVNADIVQTEQQGVDNEAFLQYNKNKPSYHSFSTEAMKWARSAARKAGDQRVLYNARDNTWNVIEPSETDDVFVVVKSVKNTSENKYRIKELIKGEQNDGNREQSRINKSVHKDITGYRNIGGNDRVFNSSVGNQGANGQNGGLHRRTSDNDGNGAVEKADGDNKRRNLKHSKNVYPDIEALNTDENRQRISKIKATIREINNNGIDGDGNDLDKILSIAKAQRRNHNNDNAYDTERRANSGNGEISEEQSSSDGVRYNRKSLGTQRSRVTIFDGELSERGKENWRDLKRARNNLNSIAGGKNFNIALIDGGEGIKGVTVNGEDIYIKAELVENGTWAKTLVHELTHFTEGSPEYKKFMAYLLSDKNSAARKMAELTAEGNAYGFTRGNVERVSAYTKTQNPIDFIQNSDIVYADKKRTTPLLRTIGFQMPIELNESGSIGSISYNGQNVNISGKSFSEIVNVNVSKKTKNTAEGNAYGFTRETVERVTERVNENAEQNSVDKDTALQYNKKGSPYTFKFLHKSFPSETEAQSEAHRLAVWWTRRPYIKVGDQALISMNDRWYLIEKFDDAENGYQVEAFVPKSEYNRIYKEIKANGYFGQIKSVLETAIEYDKRNRSNNSSTGTESGFDSSKPQYRRKSNQILRLDRGEADRGERSSSDRGGDSSRGSAYKQGDNLNSSDTDESNAYGFTRETVERVTSRMNDNSNTDGIKGKRVLQYSKNENFTEEIDEWSKDGRPEDGYFVLGMTGDVLQGLGAIESDIYMLSDKINTILQQHPEMTLDEIKKLPDILEDPVLILKSRNVGRGEKANTRLVVFGNIKAKNGQPILSVLDLRPNEKNLIIDDMQKLTSAYTKTQNPIDFIQNSDIVYADKKRTTPLLRSIGFQMPIELNESGSIGSISYKGRFVNIFGKSFSEIVNVNISKENVNTNSENNSMNESDTEFVSELIAGLAEDSVGADGAFIDKLVRGKDKLTAKILNTIEDMTAYLASRKTPEARAQYKSLKHAEKLFMNALKAAGKSYRNGKIIGAVEEEESELQYSFGNSKSGMANDALLPYSADYQKKRFAKSLLMQNTPAHTFKTQDSQTSIEDITDGTAAQALIKAAGSVDKSSNNSIPENSQKVNTKLQYSKDGIKETEVSKQGTTENGVAQNSRSVTISIPEDSQKVNTNLQYSKKSQGQRAQDEANTHRQKVYTKQDARSVISTIVSEHLNTEDGYFGKLIGKSRDAAIESLWLDFNKAKPSEKVAQAYKLADYIIQNATLEGMETTPETELAMERVSVLRDYMHKFDLSGIREEIKHVYDKDSRAISLLWGKREGGISPDSIVAELEEKGIIISAENPADIMFEIHELYRSSRDVIRQEGERTLKEALDQDEYAAMRQKIVREIMGAHTNKGKPSTLATVSNNYEKILKRMKGEFREVAEKNKRRNRVIYIFNQIKSQEKGAFVSASEYQNRAFKEGFEKLTSTLWRGNLREDRAVRAEIKKVYEWYINPENRLFHYENGEATTLYNATLAEALDTLGNGEGRFSLPELKTFEFVAETVKHMIDTYNKVWDGEKWIDTKTEAKRYVRRIEANRRYRARQLYRFAAIGKYNRMFLDNASVFRAADCYEDDGFFTEAFESLRRGLIGMQIAEADMREKAEDFYKRNRNYVKRLTEEEIEYRGQKLTMAQFISLYMTAKRKQSHLALAKTGFKCADKKGDAIDFGALASDPKKITTEEQASALVAKMRSEMESSLTKQDMEYIAVLEEIYRMASELKIKTDMVRWGYSNALKSYYYPIKRADQAKNADVSFFDEMMATDMTFNRDTVKNAARLYVEPVNTVFDRHIHGVALYSNLALTLESITRVINVNVSDVGKDSITKRVGDERYLGDTYKALEKLIGDIKGMRVTGDEGFSKLWSRVRSNYAKATLAANPKIFATQLSSFFAATSILEYKNMVKGFGVSDKFKDVDKYCSLAKLRNTDNTVVKAQTLSDRTGKVSDVLLTPVGKIDRWVVVELFGGCQAQIEAEGGAKIGTEENKIAAGKLLERVILETQQNSLVTERSQAMRSEQEYLKFLTMFSADAMKVMGRVIDSIGEVSVLRAKKKDFKADPNKNAAEIAALEKERAKLAGEIKEYRKSDALTKTETDVISDTALQERERTRLLPVSDEADVISDTILENQASTRLLPASNVSIPQLIEKINPKDKNIFKYIPDEFLSQNQLDAKNKALEIEEEKYAKKIERDLANRRGQINDSNSSTTTASAKTLSKNSIPQNLENVNSNFENDIDEHEREIEKQKKVDNYSEKKYNVDITDDEQAALLSYKSSSSYKINAKLRDGIELNEHEQHIVDNLDSALDKLPQYKGKTYRNVWFDSEAERNTFIDEHNIVVVYEGYTSTSVSKDGYTLEGDYSVHFVIEGVNGRDVYGYGNNFESEILFPRDSTFIVDKIEYASDGTPTIFLTEDYYGEEAIDRGRNQDAPSSDYRGQQEISAAGNFDKMQRVYTHSSPKAEVQILSGKNTNGYHQGQESLRGVQPETITEDYYGEEAIDRGRNQDAFSSDYRGQQEISAETKENKMQPVYTSDTKRDQMQVLPGKNTQGYSFGKGSLRGVQSEVDDYVSELEREISSLDAQIKKLKSEPQDIDGKIKRANGKARRAVAALTAQSVFMAAIALAFKWLYAKTKDKEKEEIIADTAFDFVGNMLGGLPLWRDVYSCISDGFEVDIFNMSVVNNFLDSCVQCWELVTDAASGDDITTNDALAKVKKLGVALGPLFGLPVRNTYNLVTGVSKRFFPRVGYNIESVFEAQPYSSDLKKAIENGDEKMVATIAGLMTKESIGSQSKNVQSALSELVGQGYDVLPRSLGDTVTYGGQQIELTAAQKKRFRKLYDISDQSVEELVSLSQFKAADDKIKAKALRFIYDTYWQLALADILETDEANKNVLFAEAIDIEKLALIISTARTFEADKDRNGNAIAGSKKKKVMDYIESLNMSAAQKYMIAGYLGYRNLKGQDKVEAYISKLSLTKQEKTALLEYSGYDAA